METEKIVVANLKCDGCATTIRKELLKIKGVIVVEVEPENDTVEVTYEDVDRTTILNKLLSLGYPEATEENGLLTKVKSYVSCMIGKIDIT
jgi:copper chaperone